VTQLAIATQLTIVTITDRGSELFYSLLWLSILFFVSFPWPEALTLLDL
jgi:hypothetical protein